VRSRFRAKAHALAVGLLLAAVVVLLAGCSTRPERTTKISQDWSRGQRLGYASLQQFSALDVEPDGATVHVAWSGREEAGESTEIYYVQIDRQGNVVTRQVLPYLFLPRQPVLAANSRGRRDAKSSDGVFYMLLDEGGVPSTEGLQLSSPEESADGYAAIAHRDGQLDVFWSIDNSDSGLIYYRSVSPTGEALSDPLFITGGIEPAVQLGADGSLHLAWLYKRGAGGLRVRYAYFQDGRAIATEGHEIGSAPTDGVGVRRPLRLGLDEERVYITWSVEWRSGMSAGSAIAPLFHFPVGQPGMVQVDSIVLPQSSEAYETSMGPSGTSDAYQLENLRLASFRVMGSTSPFLEAPNVATGQGSELAIVVGAQVAFRRSDDTQLTMAIYDNGQMVGYELVGRTSSLSSWPVLDTDDEGHLYLVWVDYDTPDAHGVYFSSTHPEVRSNLDKRTRQDVVLGVISAGWGVMSGISLIPLVLILLVPVVLWCGAWYIVGVDDALTEPRPLIGFAIALVVYYVAKLMVMAPVLMAPPGLRLIPGPLRSVWSIVLIVLVGAISAVVLWRAYWRKADRPALFPAALWFTVVDGLLTLLLYGMPFFGD